jgi:hypothetical protein
MQVATTAPHTSRELLAVGPHMAKDLTVVALCKASLSSELLCLDDIMDKAIQLFLYRDRGGVACGFVHWVLFEWLSFASH